jgi:hypothetical protein
LARWLRKQPGLDWDLWLNLQNDDEIGIQHEFFTAEWFNGGSSDADGAGAPVPRAGAQVRFSA